MILVVALLAVLAAGLAVHVVVPRLSSGPVRPVRGSVPPAGSRDWS